MTRLAWLAVIGACLASGLAATIGGCGGSSGTGIGDDGGGSNGSSGSSGSSGDAGSASNPGRITCGSIECQKNAGQACCDTVEADKDASTHTCGSLASGSFCFRGATQECDEKADCQGANVCCIQFLLQGISATCMPSCITGAERFQACKTTAECESGGPCAQHTCPAGDTIRTCEKPKNCQ